MNKNIKKFLFFLVLFLLLICFSSCAKTSSAIYRDYTGESENYEVSIRVQPEYDGSTTIPEGIAYNDEKLTTSIYYEIEYTGKSDEEDLRTIQIDLGCEYTLFSHRKSDDGSSLFDENNKYIAESSIAGIDLAEHEYYAKFTLSDGSKEKVYTELTDSNGSAADLDLVYGE